MRNMTLQLLKLTVLCLLIFAADARAQNDGMSDAAQKLEAERRARALLDAPLESRSQAQGSEQAPVSSPAPGSFSDRFLLILAVAAAAYGIWRYMRAGTKVEPVLVPEKPAQPRFDIVMPERNDYPVLNNTAFLDLAVDHGILSGPEKESLVDRFKGNAFAILRHLSEQLPDQRSLLGQLWGNSIGVAYVDPFKTDVQYEKLSLLKEEFLEQHPVLIISELEGVLTVATYNPGDTATLKDIENITGRFVSPVFAFPDRIAACLAIGKTTVASLSDRLSELPAFSNLDEAYGNRDWTSMRVISDFARDLMLLAVRKKASDIHIEPYEDVAVVRFRIDGVLQKILNLNKTCLPFLINVVKIRAGVDIAEKRRPQDGHISLDLGGRQLDIRFSSVPTIYGEKLVLRLLGQSQFVIVPDLESLGCSSKVLKDMLRIINSPNGVFFVTGPTGSGKTTTLYSALKRINQTGMNIMTVEDPVEYHLPGVNQVQTNPQAGITFVTALRAFLRQDPDVILVGEVRDIETAKIAAQAALTGHLVLTTMHTNNALQAITRLMQIGVEPFLVAPSIIGVMAQRLVRRLCHKCREKYEIPPEIMNAIFEWDGKTRLYAYKAKGCKECDHTGYSGRIAIHELFVIDDETREQIAHGATILDINHTATAKGFTTMRYDGIKKVLRGITTFEEIDYVTVDSE